MAGLLGYALAGGMAGAGEGMVAQAKAKREAALEEVKNNRIVAREREEREARQNKIVDTFQDENGNIVAVTATGNTKILSHPQSGAPLREQPELPSASDFIDLNHPKNPEKWQQVRAGSEKHLALIKDGWVKGNPQSDASLRGQPKLPSASNFINLYHPNNPKEQKQVRAGSKDHLALIKDGWLKGNPPKDKAPMTAAQTRLAMATALRNATTKGRYGDTVDWQVYVNELSIYEIDTTNPKVIERVRIGLRDDIKEQVKADADSRSSLFKTEAQEYDGKTKKQWIADETERLINKRLMELGLTPPAKDGLPRSTGRQTGTTPEGRPIVANEDGSVSTERSMELGLTPPEPNKPKGTGEARKPEPTSRRPRIGDTATNKETEEKLIFTGRGWEPMN